MKLSERLLWNAADRYVLESSGFPLQRIEELDFVFLRMNETLVIRIYTLAEPILLELPDYSSTIIPQEFLEQLKDVIDLQFSDVSRSARQTLWAFASNYLWNSCHNTLSKFQYERRFKDPELGELFRLLEKAKGNGLFGCKDLLE